MPIVATPTRNSARIYRSPCGAIHREPIYMSWKETRMLKWLLGRKAVVVANPPLKRVGSDAEPCANWIVTCRNGLFRAEDGRTTIYPVSMPMQRAKYLESVYGDKAEQII